jgi:hypothetical protein
MSVGGEKEKKEGEKGSREEGIRDSSNNDGFEFC